MFVPMVVLMSVVAFAIIQAPPGDFLTSYVAQLEASGDEVDMGEVAALRQHYGLDQPLYIQYLKWIRGIVQWDLGVSLEWRQPVAKLINERLLLTALLGAFTVMFTWTLSIPIGIVSAVKKYSAIDYFFTFVAYFGVGTPNFLFALVAMWLAFSAFGVNVSGLFSRQYVDAPWSIGKFLDMLGHVWLPLLILGTAGTAHLTRIVRANLLDQLGQQYVVTARAKGLAEHRVILKYPTRIALNPFISTAGWAVPELFSGSLIVATVMNLPTIGPMLLRALLSQDMYMAGSIVLILTVLTMIGTLVSDVVLAIADPRIRMGAMS